MDMIQAQFIYESNIGALMRIRQGALLILAAAVIGTWLPAVRFASAEAERRVGERDSEVSAERIARHVEFLASDKLQGRRAGTPAADQAADYIARQFKGFNLKPAATAGFLQTFTFVASVKLGADNSFQMKADRKSTRLNSSHSDRSRMPSSA